MVEQVVVCPKCGCKIPLTEAISAQIKEQLRQELAAAMEKKEKELRERESRLEERSKSIDEMVANAVSVERSKIEKEITKKLKEKSFLEIKDLGQQLKEKEEELNKARELELEIRKERREIKEQRENLELEISRRIDKELSKVKEDVSKKMEEDYRLKAKEKDKLIDDLKKQLADVTRKAEQGSQQLQGEVLELELEDVLTAAFPSDTIEPVPKGMKGADILQRVTDDRGHYAGTIIWESKRTKNWSDGWIGKLKSDQRKAKAEIAVIASEALPKDVSHFINRSGVWITNYNFVVSLATALRFNLIQVSRAKMAMVGKSEKMEVLYTYLSGTEFKHRVEVFIEAFTAMKTDLDKEKTTVQRLWAKREKEIVMVLTNVAGMYGDLQGIMGASLPQIENLELKALISEPESAETDKQERSEET